MRGAARDAVSWRETLNVVDAQPVGGGDICRAYRATLADGRVVFVKTNATPGMFAAEAHGLAWLAPHIRTPQVIAHGDDWLALEWLELGKPDDAALGRALAQLHRAGAPCFGLDRDNLLATLPQDNTVEPDWPTFYVERRLRPIARRLGIALDLDRDRFGPPEPPARLHGDLWWGNVAAVAGAPVVFDPAVYGGHREVDLAMLALFGPLPDRLIAAYDEVYPLADGWRARLLLHQAYPLGCHAVLFGGGYVARFAAAVR